MLLSDIKLLSHVLFNIKISGLYYYSVKIVQVEEHHHVWLFFKSGVGKVFQKFELYTIIVNVTILEMKFHYVLHTFGWHNHFHDPEM